MKIVSCSVLETENIAKKLASNLKGNEVIAFYGDLGVGKTAFTRGIADFFGIKNMVSSPTFSIVNEYQTNQCNIYHFDMYRINSFEDLESTGFFEYLDKGILIIEWSENINEILPKNCIKITIDKLDDKNNRMINIEGVDFK